MDFWGYSVSLVVKSFGVKSEGAFTEPLGSANQSASFSQNVYQWASLIRVKNWKMKKGFLRQGLSAKFLKFSRAIVKTKEEFDRLIFCDWLSCPITHSHYAAPSPHNHPLSHRIFVYFWTRIVWSNILFADPVKKYRMMIFLAKFLFQKK